MIGSILSFFYANNEIITTFANLSSEESTCPFSADYYLKLEDEPL